MKNDFLKSALIAFKNLPEDDIAKLLGKNITSVVKYEEFLKLRPILIFEILDRTERLDPNFVIQMIESINKCQTIDIHELLFHIRTNAEPIIKHFKLDTSYYSIIEHQDNKIKDLEAKINNLTDEVTELIRVSDLKYTTLIDENNDIKRSIDDLHLTCNNFSAMVTPELHSQTSTQVELNDTLGTSIIYLKDNFKAFNVKIRRLNHRAKKIPMLQRTMGDIERRLDKYSVSSLEFRDILLKITNILESAHISPDKSHELIQLEQRINNIPEDIFAAGTNNNYSPVESVSDPGPLKSPRYIYQNIHNCCAVGDLESIRLLLLKNKSLLEERNFAGLTPLMYATMNNKKKVCLYLIQHGADVHAKTYIIYYFIMEKHRYLSQEGKDLLKLLIFLLNMVLHDILLSLYIEYFFQCYTSKI